MYSENGSDSTCEYIITDDDGTLENNSTLEVIGDFGILGAIIDPLVLQVPDDAVNVVATFNNSGVDQPLLVTETTSFDVTPSISVQSEAGSKFLILELPAEVAATLTVDPTDFNFSLDFDVADPNSLSVKPMLTARVDQNNAPYYLPLLPCVTDFAEVAPMQVPVGFAFEDIRVQTLAIVNSGDAPVCDGVVYDFTAGVPTSSTTSPTTSSTIAPTTAPTTSPAATTQPTAAPTTPPPPAPPTPTTNLPETGSANAIQIWLATAMVLAGTIVFDSARRRPLG